MLRVAQRIEPCDPDPFGKLDHGQQRFGGESLAPGVPSQHVSRHRPVRRLDHQSGAAE